MKKTTITKSSMRKFFVFGLFLGIAIGWYCIPDKAMITENEQSLQIHNVEYQSIEYSALQLELLKLVNTARIESDVDTLKLNATLNIAATQKAKDMFKYNYFAHNSPINITPWDWIHSVNYNYRYAGENIAMDFDTIENTHIALMNSPSHKENIVNQNYNEIGIAIVNGKFNNRQTTIIVEMFGTEW